MLSFTKQPAALSEGFGAISVDRSSRATTQLPDLQQAKVVLLAWARVKSEHGYHLVRKKKSIDTACGALASAYGCKISSVGAVTVKSFLGDGGRNGDGI